MFHSCQDLAALSLVSYFFLYFQRIWVLNPGIIVIIPANIQVHQDEEANLEMSNFEALEMPPSQTGLNVSGVQVQELHLKHHDHIEKHSPWASSSSSTSTDEYINLRWTSNIMWALSQGNIRVHMYSGNSSSI